MKLLLAALCAVLTACGTSSGHGDTYASARAVATAAQCTTIKAVPDGEVTLYATDEVSCRHAGRFTLIDWFKDTASLTNFKASETGYGTRILYGNSWAILCAGADCGTIQKVMGGSIE